MGKFQSLRLAAGKYGGNCAFPRKTQGFRHTQFAVGLAEEIRCGVARSPLDGCVDEDVAKAAVETGQDVRRVVGDHAQFPSAVQDLARHGPSLDGIADRARQGGRAQPVLADVVLRAGAQHQGAERMLRRAGEHHDRARHGAVRAAQSGQYFLGFHVGQVVVEQHAVRHLARCVRKGRHGCPAQLGFDKPVTFFRALQQHAAQVGAVILVVVDNQDAHAPAAHGRSWTCAGSVTLPSQ